MSGFHDYNETPPNWSKYERGPIGFLLSLRGVGDGNALVLEHFLQFASLEHFFDDVGAADKFTLDVELGNGWPIRKGLDAVTDAHIFEHIDVFEIDAEMIKNLHAQARKSTLWCLVLAFHEQYHIIGCEGFSYPVMNFLFAHVISFVTCLFRL